MEGLSVGLREAERLRASEPKGEQVTDGHDVQQSSQGLDLYS